MVRFALVVLAGVLCIGGALCDPLATLSATLTRLAHANHQRVTGVTRAPVDASAAAAALPLLLAADSLAWQCECAALVNASLASGERGTEDVGEPWYMDAALRSRGVTDADSADAPEVAPAAVAEAAAGIVDLMLETAEASAIVADFFAGVARAPVRSAALAFSVAEQTYERLGLCTVVDPAMRAAARLLRERRDRGTADYCSLPDPHGAVTSGGTVGGKAQDGRDGLDGAGVGLAGGAAEGSLPELRAPRDLRSVQTGAIEAMAWDYVHHCARHTGDHARAYDAGHRFQRLRHDNHDMVLNMRRERLHAPLNDGFAFVSTLSLRDILAGRIRPTDAYDGEGWANEAAGLFVLTVATEEDPGLDVLRASCDDYGINLRVAAMGERFSGYGLKLKVLAEELTAARDGGYTRFLFVDAFDTVIVSPVAEIISKIDHFAEQGHGVIVSAESSCWPDPALCDLFPRVETAYRYPNTGGIAGSIDAFLELLGTMAIADKPVCVDDQHEMQLVYLAYPTTAYKLDSDAVLFHSLVNAEKDVVRLRRPRIRSTGTAPSVFHANGYDKLALGRILLARNWFYSDWEASKFFTLAFLSHKEKTVARDGGVPRCYNVSVDHAADNYPATGTEFDGVHGAEGDAGGDDVREPVDMAKIDAGAWSAARTDATAALRALADTERTDESRIAYLRGLAEATAALRGMVGEIDRTVYFHLPEHRALCARELDPAEQAFAQCRTDPTMPACFNFDRCPPGKPIKVYVYPDAPDAASTVSLPYRTLLSAIRGSPRYTSDPDEACLFVPSIDTYCTLENCLVPNWLDIPSQQTDGARAIGTALAGLPFWNQGRNHIIFQHHEAPCSPYNVGAAVLAKTDISDFHYRWAHDVSLPYVPLRQFGSAGAKDGKAEKADASDASASPAVDASARTQLIGFKGARTSLAQDERDELSALHDPAAGVVVVTLCRVFGYVDERCRLEEQEYVRHSYEDVMTKSHYGFVLEGFGYGSYRLLEVLAAGAVPVIAVDHWVLPLSEMLDWREFAVLVPQQSIHDGTAVETVRAIPEARREALRARGQELYRRFFVSQERNVLAAIEIVAARIERNGLAALADRGLPGNPSMTNTEMSNHFLASDLYWPNTMPRESEDQLP